MSSYRLGERGARDLDRVLRLHRRIPRPEGAPGWLPRRDGGDPSAAGGVLRARTPVGGISPGAVGDVTLYDADHELGEETLAAANRSASTAFAGEIDVYVAYSSREREWQVIQRFCP